MGKGCLVWVFGLFLNGTTLTTHHLLAYSYCWWKDFAFVSFYVVTVPYSVFGGEDSTTYIYLYRCDYRCHRNSGWIPLYGGSFFINEMHDTLFFYNVKIYYVCSLIV